MACCRRFVIAFETTTRHISHWITYILPLLFGSIQIRNWIVCVCHLRIMDAFNDEHNSFIWSFVCLFVLSVLVLGYLFLIICPFNAFSRSLPPPLSLPLSRSLNFSSCFHPLAQHNLCIVEFCTASKSFCQLFVSSFSN